MPLLIAMLFGVPGGSVLAQCDDVAIEPPTTILVIDKSGSMTQAAGTWKSDPVDADRTPWQAVRARIEQFLSRSPDGNQVRTAVFNERVDWLGQVRLSDESRRSLLGKLDEEAPRNQQGRTALYKAMVGAFEQAKLLSRENPTHDIAIIVYTDGANSENEVREADVATEFRELVELNENVWLYYTPIVRGQTISTIVKHPHAIEVGFRYPVPLQFDRTSFVLQNARLKPQQNIRPYLCGADAVFPLLKNHRMHLEFQPDDGQDIQIASQEIALTRGELSIPVQVLNGPELDVSRAYSGRFLITYPDLPEFEVRAPASLRLIFQAEEKPRISNMRPEEGMVIPSGTEQVFVIQTLDDAQVIWDFGDGTSKGGREVTHSFTTSGERTVRVSVKAANGLEASKTATIRVIDVGISIAPVKPPFLSGFETSFQPIRRGPVKRVEWLVNGKKYQPNLEGEGLRMAPDRPGRLTVQALGYAETAIVKSDELEIRIGEPPRIVVTPSPAIVGKATQLALEGLPPSVDSVTWTFHDGETIKDSRASISRTFPVRQSYRTQATIQSGGRQVAVVPGDFSVIEEPLKAYFESEVRKPSSWFSLMKWFYRKTMKGDELILQDHSTGSIRSATWRYRSPGQDDWTELPDDATTLVLNAVGEYEMERYLEGYPDGAGTFNTARSSGSIVVHPTPNLGLLALNVLGALGVVACSAHVLLRGNRPRHWKVYYDRSEYPEASGTSSYLGLAKRWNWWRKKARIAITSLNGDGYWDTEEGRKEYVEVLQRGGADFVRYSGESDVGLNPPGGTERSENTDTTLEVMVFDDRGEGSEDTDLYLKIKKEQGSELGPRLLFLVIAGICGYWIYWTFS